MSEINKAIEILKSGSVVGIPTETVYGLAGSIENPAGVDAIFATKERPFFDPLIVHASNIEEIKKYTKGWNELCQILAEKIWPGPMTLILPKSDLISDKITSGLDTVGVRIPNHPVTLKLIQQLGHPVAAPSANKFKKVSPTTAEHVQKEFPHLFVLDGGACKVGIESTILKAEENRVTIYRPGMITPSQLKEILPPGVEVNFQESPIAPGHLKHHYMPKKPVFLMLEGEKQSEYASSTSWKIPQDSVQAARELYGKLREHDQKDTDCIEVILSSSMLEEENFRGIINRLIKASYWKSDRIKPEY